ncbi:hypothetical protein P9436_15840 [Lysinibacillus capsici]|uniref:Uncharacterized protein n=1 Tax=Lysinibacillus capsici TaxID=2115968 RepID=A0ABY8KHT4_9BACI|nr:hypothetical protein [Lysinibacillus capsici]MED4700533.1 hypothetical protein [Lysinibacillus capsici]WGF39068.1 hypothetical protein QBO96_02055 [Lysinibacillus capsici]
MKKYRLGYDYVFLADTPFMYKGVNIGATSVNVLFKVFDTKGNEKLFESENELNEQKIDFGNGNSCYLFEFIRCFIDTENVLNFEPNIKLLREFGCSYTLQWEKTSYTKDILINGVLNPEDVSEVEFMELMKNNMELFDIRDNYPAQTTSFFTQEIIMLHDYKLKNVPVNYGLGKEETVSKYRYEYNGEKYLVEVVLDIGNMIEVAVFELDDNTIKYVGDTGENVFFVFNTMTVLVKDLQSYVNKWIEEHKELIFHGNCLLEEVVKK